MIANLSTVLDEIFWEAVWKKKWKTRDDVPDDLMILALQDTRKTGKDFRLCTRVVDFLADQKSFRIGLVAYGWMNRGYATIFSTEGLRDYFTKYGEAVFQNCEKRRFGFKYRSEDGEVLICIPSSQILPVIEGVEEIWPWKRNHGATQ